MQSLVYVDTRTVETVEEGTVYIALTWFINIHYWEELSILLVMVGRQVVKLGVFAVKGKMSSADRAGTQTVLLL